MIRAPTIVTGGSSAHMTEATPDPHSRAARGKAMYDVIALTRRDLPSDSESGMNAGTANVVAINDAGVACGSELLSANLFVPTIWSPNGLSRRLECGPCGGAAVAISGRGVAVGYEYLSPDRTERRPVAWVNGEIVVLPALGRTSAGGNDTAAAINLDGVIGGRSDGKYVVWTGIGDGRLDVREISAGFSSFLGPNHNGLVSGRVGLPEQGEHQQLGKWFDGDITVRDFPAVPGTWRYYVTAVNRLDQVLITGSDQQYDDLGRFAVVSGRREMVVDRRRNGLKLIAHDLNDAGAVVGQAELESGRCFPFIWNAGEPVDLNRLIPYDVGFTIFAATAINNNGAILACADDHEGIEHQVLLTPVRRGNGQK